MESGHTPSRKRPEYWGGNIPWIGIRDAKKFHGGAISETLETTNELGIANSSARVLPKGTVCLSRTASVGYVVKMGRDMATSQDFANWVCSDNLDPDYLVHLLLAEAGALSRFSSGSVHQTIYYPELKAFHICLPPLEEQQRIVAILDEAFEGLDRARANAEANLASARELFDAYLTQIFSDPPADWKEATLGSKCHRITVGHVGPMAKRYAEKGIPFLRSQNVRPFWIDLTEVKFIDDAFMSELRKSELRPGDVAIVRTGYPGTAAVIPDNLPLANCADLVIARPGPDLSPHFLAMLLNSSFGKSHVAHVSVGAAQQHFNVGAAKASIFPLPPRPTQERLADRAAEIREQTASLEDGIRRKIADISDLRQSLLQKAFAGDLT